jgi:predicted HAD superfamily Cof-like phosphohydrolase
MNQQLLKHLRENIGLLNSLRDRDNPLEIAEDKWCETVTDSFIKKYSPYVSEVEEFNKMMGKPNNYTPNIPSEDEYMFVYNFVLEELNEYKEACEKGDIVGVLDALCDITYVSLGNGALLHGLKDHLPEAYAEVQASNMSKSCKTEEEAKETVEVRQKEKGYQCHYEKVGDVWVVYRTVDRKVQKSINYFPPNLKQFL